MIEFVLGLLVGIGIPALFFSVRKAIGDRQRSTPVALRPDHLRVLIRFVGVDTFASAILLLNGAFFLPLFLPVPGLFRLFAAASVGVLALLFIINRARKTTVSFMKVILFVAR